MCCNISNAASNANENGISAAFIIYHIGHLPVRFLARHELTPKAAHFSGGFSHFDDGRK